MDAAEIAEQTNGRIRQLLQSGAPSPQDLGTIAREAWLDLEIPLEFRTVEIPADKRWNLVWKQLRRENGGVVGEVCLTLNVDHKPSVACYYSDDLPRDIVKYDNAD